jgi:hypothetical protein
MLAALSAPNRPIIFAALSCTFREHSVNIQ